MALDASELRVAGNLVFSPRLEADATFERCRVGGDLDLSGLHIVVAGAVAPSVVFSDFIVDRRLAVSEDIQISDGQKFHRKLVDPLRPLIWLNGVDAAILADNGGKGWGNEIRLALDGLVYKHVEQAGGDPPEENRFIKIGRYLIGKYHLRISEDRKVWLALQYRRKRRKFALRPWRFGTTMYVINRRTYRAQPYEQLAKVLDDQGWNEDSRTFSFTSCGSTACGFHGC